ncbi:MAG: hypothetical protein K0R49_992, partial [Burkholderiales bacterium]|nr:hypothetical protein [Burkholderiales bacterium]
ADFNTSGVKVSVAQIPQISGFTQNDFTHVVAYEVTAEDGSTTTYLVTVTVALSSAKAITTFSIAGATGVFDGFNIAVLVPHGTRLYTAVDFSTTGVGVTVNGVPQVTGTTAVDFTAPAIYTITAADGTTQNYIVTVTVAKSSAKSLTSFILADESGVITGQNIAVTVPFGTNLTTATATFATTGTHVFVGGIQQISEVTPNNFESNVSYVVTAADGSTATYTVTVIVSPQYVYVGNSGSNTISKYNINESNGQLTNPATFDSGGAGTINIVLDPSKKHLYSLNYTSGTISVFDINTSNGLLSQKYTISNGGERPLDMTFSSTGAFAFVTNQSFSSTGSITTYSVNASTGELTFIAKIGLIISSMSGSFNIKTDPTKSYVYIANRTNNIFPGYGDIEWFSINNSTGQLTPGGHFNDGMSFPADIVIAPSGNFSYILDSLIGNSNISTHEVNKATGAIENRFRNDRTNGSYSNHLTISPSGLFLYVNNLYSSTISMFSVNTATGILTSLGAVTAGTSPEILQLSTSGNYAYVTSNGNRTVLMYKVNPETGVLTALVPPTIATGSGPIGIVVK